MQARMQYRSLFWPLILIGVGVVWLLTNMGVLSLAGISVLFRLWPLILIVIGLDLLFGRRSPAVGGLIGLGAVALIVVLMLVGPSLGWAQDVEAQTASYEEPLGDVESAQVNLNLAIGELNVTPLVDSDNLFEANINYVGEVVFETEGQTDRVINLRQQDNVNLGFGFFNFLFNPDQKLKWDVQLDPTVPLDLTVNTGTGGSILNLGDFDQLTGLRLNTGTGGIDVTLPNTVQSYRVEVDTGTGGGSIRIEEGAAVDMRVGAGTGGFTIDVPDDAAVRLVGSTGTGSINVPPSFASVSGDDDSITGDSGTWETAGFDTAERQITINFVGGTGGLTVK